MKGLFSCVLGVVVSLSLVLVLGPAGIALASSPNLVNSGFESGGLSGWSTGTVVDFAGVVGPDGFGTPYSGEYMARLGTPRYQGQPIGPNEIYQDFVASEPTLFFAYNIYTYDYQGYNHFEYELTDMSTATVIAYYSQSAWGASGDTSLKSTGWQLVRIDISGYIGSTLRLRFNCSGSFDTQYATWAYIDYGPTPLTPTLSQWGITGMTVVFATALVWVGRRRFAAKAGS